MQQIAADHRKTASTRNAYQPVAKAAGLAGWMATPPPVVLEHHSMAEQDDKMAM